MNIFDEISQLLNNQEFEKAINLAQTLPSQTDQLNALGIIFYYTGNLEKSYESFLKVLELDPFHPAASYNFAKLAYQRGDYRSAWRFSLRAQHKFAGVYELAADATKALGNLHMATYYYTKAIKYGAAENVLEKYNKLLSQLSKKQSMVIFASPNERYFSYQLSNVLSGVYNVEVVLPKNADEVLKSFNQADIIWFEGVNNILAEVSKKLPKNERKVIVRIYDLVGGSVVNDINWYFIDRIIFSSNVVRKFYEERYEEVLSIPRVTIEKCVNLSEIVFSKRSNKKIALICDMSYLGLLSLLEIAKKLSEKGEFEFYLKVPENSPVEVIKAMKIWLKKYNLDNTFFLSPVSESFYDFLIDKDVAIFYTFSEEISYFILLSMAMGLPTFVYEANEIIGQNLPKECVFGSIEEVVSKIILKDLNPVILREFVEENYPLEREIESIINLIEQIDEDELFSEMILYVLTKTCSSHLSDEVRYSE
ncbi:MAG: hypothetical protein N2Z58_04785 [Fervidobacterium sp.]|nr:hypothetical protein [Fervidobacterium sp.]